MINLLTLPKSKSLKHFFRRRIPSEGSTQNMDSETRRNSITNLLTYIFPRPGIVTGKCLQPSGLRKSEPLKLVTILGN